MRAWKLNAIFIFGTVVAGFPLALALLFVFWLFTQEMSYVEFLHNTDESTQYVAIFATGFGVFVGTLISLNFVVYLNAKYNWLTESALKEKLGEELQRYVFVRYS